MNLMKLVRIRNFGFWFLKIMFPIWQKIGIHITPNYFYSPIPDTRTLKDELWKKKSELVGIDINEENQIKLLYQFSSKFKLEYESFPIDKASMPHYLTRSILLVLVILPA